MPASALTESVGTAVTTGAEALLAHRRDDGAFVFGAHHASPLNTAGALTALHFADPEGSAETIERGVTWLCETQRDDGGWAMRSVPTEPLTTALAAAALHLLAPRRAASAVRAARARFEELGGSAAVPEPAMTALIRQFHTFAGLPHEGAQRRLPLELLLFPGLSRRLLSLRLPIYASQALARPPTAAAAPRAAPWTGWPGRGPWPSSATRTNARAPPAGSAPTPGSPDSSAWASPVPARRPTW
ncbi:hypothetical protein [Streptomyces rapamycinicus]|uniref:hypothetical protein n=1 Tax=Streptomyces rapamycinicus TaxID=1226757 RepID=UPI0032D9622E